MQVKTRKTNVSTEKPIVSPKNIGNSDGLLPEVNAGIRKHSVSTAISASKMITQNTLINKNLLCTIRCARRIASLSL